MPWSVVNSFPQLIMTYNYISNWQDCVDHILSCYPEEGGGIVTTNNLFIPIVNISETPLDTFEFAPVELARDDVKCILHSHPYDPNVALDHDPRIPSKTDMQGQIDTAVEWAIVITEGENVTQPVFWGDYSHRPDLFDREFIHNAQDCLAFMSDWQYKNFGLELPRLARDFDWFEQGFDYMEDVLEPWGFVDVTHLPEEKGDVVFYKIQSSVVNHLGVIIEPNRVAHHLFGRFPKSEPTAIWAKYAMKRIRHKTNPAFSR